MGRTLTERSGFVNAPISKTSRRAEPRHFARDKRAGQQNKTLPSTLPQSGKRAEVREENLNVSGVSPNNVQWQSRWQSRPEEPTRLQYRTSYSPFLITGQSANTSPRIRNPIVPIIKRILSGIEGIFPNAPPTAVAIRNAWKSVSDVFDSASSLLVVQNTSVTFQNLPSSVYLTGVFGISQENFYFNLIRAEARGGKIEGKILRPEALQKMDRSYILEHVHPSYRYQLKEDALLEDLVVTIFSLEGRKLEEFHQVTFPSKTAVIGLAIYNPWNMERHMRRERGKITLKAGDIITVTIENDATELVHFAYGAVLYLQDPKSDQWGSNRDKKFHVFLKKLDEEKNLKVLVEASVILQEQIKLYQESDRDQDWGRAAHLVNYKRLIEQTIESLKEKMKFDEWLGTHFPKIKEAVDAFLASAPQSQERIAAFADLAKLAHDPVKFAVLKQVQTHLQANWPQSRNDILFSSVMELITRAEAVRLGPDGPRSGRGPERSRRAE
ncbi:MAG: hypothetical protein HY584_00880, partial [Candidatus Omnitrophica bacterium]|nr:hypothetical protein [Candidatus Omnitrophota bacterium]